MEHALTSSWTCYAHKYLTKGGYTNALVALVSFDTIESFWRFHNNMPRLSSCFAKGRMLKASGDAMSSLSIFKEDITPEWEHVKNVGGVICEYKGCYPIAEIEETWQTIVIEAIRGAAPDTLNGVRIVYKPGKRPFYKLELWFGEEFEPRDLDFVNETGCVFEKCHKKV